MILKLTKIKIFSFFVLVSLLIIFLLLRKESTHFSYSSPFYLPVEVEQNITFSLTENPFFLQIKRIPLEKVKLVKHKETPQHVRAIYLSSWVAGSPLLRKKLLDFAQESRINSVIIDIKDSTGYISFPMENEYVQEYQSSQNRIQDIDTLIEDIHNRDLYLIGRIVAFQDPYLSQRDKRLALLKKNGEVWKNRKGLSFTNPKKKEVWLYLSEIAKEAYERGFDEINFDYMRYPSDGKVSQIDFSLEEGETKRDALKKFFTFLDQSLRKEEEIPVSVDFFGFTASREEGVPSIGQSLEDALEHFDAVAPMVYPSHYPKNYLGFSNSAEHPYDVVAHEMKLAGEKVLHLGYDKDHLRTWIQDFSLGAFYGKEKVLDQIRASYDQGIYSYMVWDPKNRYTRDAYSVQSHPSVEREGRREEPSPQRAL